MIAALFTHRRQSDTHVAVQLLMEMRIAGRSMAGDGDARLAPGGFAA